MPFEPGAKLGSYEIIAPVATATGAEVYTATDTAANRSVDIQIIPPQWTAAPDFAGRKQLFERATQLVAGLNHPNIRAVYEIARQDDVDFLVQEHLEGPILADRLKGKPLRLDEALSTAITLAGALEKIHAAGVIHRGLTPSSIAMTKDGPKLLDLGLADLRPAQSLSPVLPKAASITAADAGRKPEESIDIHYTAPEEFENKPADARSDLFSFGAILFEMVTGQKAFEGKTRAALIATIATAEPDPLAQWQPRAPRILDHVVQRCLAKDPDDRWQTAHDMLVQLRWISEGPSSGADSDTGSTRTTRIAIAAAVIAIVALAFPAVRYLRGSAAQEALQFRIPVAGLITADIALSPDGDAAAIVARPNNAEPPALFVRRMGSTAFLRLGGTEDAAQPFWSPDSRSIGFVSNSRLKTVSIAGGAPKDVAGVENFTGGSWNHEGTILYGSPKGLFRVSAEGGKPAAVTSIAAPEAGHYWPSFLPDGRHFLYLAWTAQPGSRAVYAAGLDSKEKTRLLTADSNAEYAAPGYVLFHREASLFAQLFNAGKLALAGQPVHVADDVASTPANGRGYFDVSQNGSLLYFQGANAPSGRAHALSTQFGWMDRTGNRTQTAGLGGVWGDMDLSPDGRLIAVTQQDAAGGGADIWVVDWQRDAVPTRLTLDPADDVDPVWSPDGARVAFTTYRKGNADIYVKNANNVGAETPILDTPADEIVKDWSKDGRYVAFLTGDENMRDIYALPFGPDGKPGKPLPVVQGRFQKGEPQFSYDGKWLAYTSDETSAFQVTVMSFPAGDQKVNVSREGGGQPRWRKDGKELYYKSPDGSIMAVEIKTGPRLEAGVPHKLFGSPATNPVAFDPVRHQMGVTPDGQHFLLRFGVAAAVGSAGAPGGGPTVTEAQAFSAAFGGGRGAAVTNTGPGGAAISTGLTVIQHWPMAAGKGDQ